MIGAFLLVASVLKLQDVSQAEGSSLVLICLSFLEMLVGFLCLFGVVPPILVCAMAIFFVAGTAMNAYLAVMGKQSCNCFGSVETPPIASMCLDACSAIFLVADLKKQKFALTFPREARNTIAVAVFSTLALSTSIFFTAPKRNGAEVDAVAIDCDSLKGKQFHLALDIVGGAELLNGDWEVVFVRNGCTDCESTLANYNADRRGKLAIVEVPPIKGKLPKHSADLIAYLDPYKEWLVRTPTGVKLIDGKVVDILKFP